MCVCVQIERKIDRLMIDDRKVDNRYSLSYVSPITTSQLRNIRSISPERGTRHSVTIFPLLIKIVLEIVTM